MTPEEFETICRVNGRRPQTIRNKINDILRPEGITYRDICMSDKKRARRDKLGFNLPSKETPNKEESDNKLSENTKDDSLATMEW